MPAFSVPPRRLPLYLGLAVLAGLPTTAPRAAVEPGGPPGPSGLYADYLAARFAESQADPAVAAQKALAALALDPGNAVLQRQAFLATALAGRPEALGLARVLPNQPYAQLMVVASAVSRGDWPAAARAAHRLPQHGVAAVLRPLLLAWSDQAQHRTDDALRRLRPMLRDSRVRAVAALHAGMITDLAGRTQQAAGYFRQAEAGFGPLSLRQAQIIASFEARTGHRGEALSLLSRTADHDPQFGMVLPALARNLMQRPVASPAAGIAEAYLATAGSLQEQGQNNDAVLLLRDALALRPEFSSAKLMLAEIVRAQGHPAEAAALLASVPADATLDPIVQLNQAQLLHQRGDDARALDLLASLAASCPRSPLPLAERGTLLRADGRLAEADAAYGEAIRRAGAASPSTWALYYQRAIIRDQMHDWPAAEQDLRHALALSPDQPAVLNYLGYSWADRDQHLAEAARMIAKAEAADPDDGAIVDSMGWVMLKQGNVAGAVRTLQRATELLPADPTINGHLGDAYAAAGRKLEARYQWQRALTLHPDAAEAAHLRLRLEGGIRQSARAQPEG